MIINTLVHDSIKLSRMSLLSAFVDLRKSLREKKVRDLYKLNHKDERAIPTFDIDDIDMFKAS